MTERIRVGIIGASPTRGWGTAAHIPALLALPDFAITAVATRHQASADETARRFGIPHAFTDPVALASHPEVDVVAVTVKVPEHEKLVRAALAAGKHVYCEWPLARNLAEAEGLLALATEAGVTHMIGLQSRVLPVISHVRDLVATGYVGRVLSCTASMACPVGAKGALPQASAYLADRENGANALTVATGHFLDALCYMLGSIKELSASLSTQQPEIRIQETGEIIKATAPDNVVVTGLLEGGAPVSFHFTGGRVHGPGIRVEISGTEGVLVLTSSQGFGIQMDKLTLSGARGEERDLAEIPTPESYRWVPAAVPAGPPFGVAQMYAHLAEAIRTDRSAQPNFGDAVALHRLLDTIQRASQTGVRQLL